MAEMGDKTQLLAMAFASRYKAFHVLVAVFLATILNHGMAVAAGHFLAQVIPLDVVSFIAALSFIFFGLWTIRGDKLEGEDKKETKFGPIMTVAIAFFLAEMGDKTQLATISLAVKYQSMLGVLAGTTLGMIVADAIGIIVGIVLRKHIPEKSIKWMSAVVFILFGLAGVFDALSGKIDALYVWAILALLSAGTYAAARKMVKAEAA
jgi:putative Ca2+/H+ antiporter (TMEM165/GDT1 family)